LPEKAVNLGNMMREAFKIKKRHYRLGKSGARSFWG